jgi:hypothetical protein
MVDVGFLATPDVKTAEELVTGLRQDFRARCQVRYTG